MRSIDDVAPVNQVLQRFRIESKLLVRRIRYQHGAGFVFRFVEHMRSRIAAEIFRVAERQERALVMIEPPGNFWRVGILKIDDHVFVAVKQAVFPRLNCAMRHSGEMEFRVSVESFTIEAIENCGGSGAIKAAVMKAQSYSGHEWRIRAFL